MSAYWKIPLQVLVLLLGILVFVFYTFNQPPLLFSSVQQERLRDIAAEERHGRLLRERRRGQCQFDVGIAEAIDQNTVPLGLRTYVHPVEDEVAVLDGMRRDPVAAAGEKAVNGVLLLPGVARMVHRMPKE